MGSSCNRPASAIDDVRQGRSIVVSVDFELDRRGKLPVRALGPQLQGVVRGGERQIERDAKAGIYLLHPCSGRIARSFDDDPARVHRHAAKGKARVGVHRDSGQRLRERGWRRRRKRPPLQRILRIRQVGDRIAASTENAGDHCGAYLPLHGGWKHCAGGRLGRGGHCGPWARSGAHWKSSAVISPTTSASPHLLYERM